MRLRTPDPVIMVMLLFFLQPLTFGGFLVRLPDIQHALDLTKAELGWALFSLAIGVILMLPIAGLSLHRWGSRLILIIGFPAFCAPIVLVGVADNLPFLMGATLLVGMALAYTELGLNSFAATVEQQSSRHIMNRAHGCWSVGLLVGSLVGVQLSRLDVSLLTTALILTVMTLTFSGWLTYKMPRSKPEAEQKDKAHFNWAVLWVCVFIFGFAMSEGAMLDWSVIYLREVMGPDVIEAGYGLSIFAGRFAGDWLKQRLGQIMLARLCLSLAIIGLGLIVAQPAVWLIFVGFGLAGLGVTVGFPLSVSAASQLSGNTSKHLACLTLAAEFAFVIGPPLIGILADMISLRVAFLVLLPVLLLSFYSSRRLS